VLYVHSCPRTSVGKTHSKTSENLQKGLTEAASVGLAPGEIGTAPEERRAEVLEARETLELLVFAHLVVPLRFLQDQVEVGATRRTKVLIS